MITISQMLLTFLLNAVWQIALVAAIAAVCARLLRGAPARYRHTLWVAALVISFALPLLSASMLFRGSFFAEQAAPQSASEQVAFQAVSAETVATESAGSFIVPLGINLAIILAAAYVLFVLWRGARLFGAWRRTKAIARSGYETAFPDAVRAAIEKCRETIGIEKASVLFSTSIPVPVTIGNQKPLVILPEQLLAETDESILTTAIGHELVHISRRDYIFNLIYEFIFLPLSFHPAAALVKRRIDQTRELCCDETVAGRLLGAEDYARSLVKLAGSVSNFRPPATTTVGMGDAENLEVRVMSLLKKSELKLHKKSLLIIAAILLIAIPCVVAAVFAVRIGINEVSAQQTEKKENTVRDEEKIKREKLERELKENPNLSAEERDKLERELKGNGETQMRREKQEKAKMERIEQAKLAREVKITMEQAIQNATNYQAGTVLESGLIKHNNEVGYKFLILDKDGADGAMTLVVISGLDGRVVKTERGFLK